SVNPDHQAKAQEVINKCLPYSGNSIRVGISGVPGAGKSTSIDEFGNRRCGQRRPDTVRACDGDRARSSHSQRRGGGNGAGVRHIQAAHREKMRTHTCTAHHRKGRLHGAYVLCR
ncbi:MAG: hypothetical protein IIU07_00295, partial [Lachnospiraceae bacterium]|nr:hypothetical protein [Lachnospiraceae bacterium]